MPKTKKQKKTKKEEPKVEEKPVEEVTEPEPEPEPVQPTKEELEAQRLALLQDPHCNEDIVLVFDLESPSEKMKKYILHRKEQYIAAHKDFKQNHTNIINECNENIAALANDIRYKVEYSNKIFSDILDTFSNESKLSKLSSESDIDECWTLITDEFENRQKLFEEFTINSNKIEEERKERIQKQIQILFQTCVNTGLIAPDQIKKSLQPKKQSLKQLINEKTIIYTQFAQKLNETDSNLKAEYEDQFKDGKLRWNQLQRKSKTDIPKVADS